MELNQLKDKPGARKSRMRVGRGIGSGKGKTCGRGGKGQTARTGKSINGFEGGQMPIIRRMPKSGFNNFMAKQYATVTLDTLQLAVNTNKISGTEINAEVLKAARIIRAIGDGLRVILGKGDFKTKVKIVAACASEGAIAAVKKAGGSVDVLPAKVNKLLKPGKEGKKVLRKKAAIAKVEARKAKYSKK